MDSREFGEWIAYSRLDPFGNERGDLHVARILSMFYNAHRGKGKSESSPSDFMLDFEPPRPAGEQVLSVFQAVKSQQGND